MLKNGISKLITQSMKRQMPAFVVPFCIQLHLTEHLFPKCALTLQDSDSEIMVTTTIEKDNLMQKQPRTAKMA